MVDTYWAAALDSLPEGESAVYGPTSFLDYLDANGFDTAGVRTPSHISVDRRQNLASLVEANDTMIFRVGAAQGRGAQFALVRVPGQLDDFFLDESAFTPAAQQTRDYRPAGDDLDALPNTAADMLTAFRALPTFSETTLVNLALATGVVSDALGLDVDHIGTAPATVASTFDFHFRPHTAVSADFAHRSGQVEIDAVAATRRNGQRRLIVIEAKTGQPRSLPKHKLMYPLLGMAETSEFDIDEIIPVYLRAQETAAGVAYSVYECSRPPQSTESDPPVLSELTIRTDTHYELRVA